MPAGQSPLSPVGRLIRRLRAVRRMSQLDLAVAAGTAARHLSFAETGGSRPGRELILRIGGALRVPLPDRNTLLVAAGFPAAFPAHHLGSQAMEPVGRVLEAVLAGHEPYPAWVVRQPFTFLRANAAALKRCSPG
jgi:transcriptional regulator with XRE-family HTH domain